MHNKCREWKANNSKILSHKTFAWKVLRFKDNFRSLKTQENNGNISITLERINVSTKCKFCD